MGNMTVKLSEIESGKTFEIGGVEFIKFSEENGETIAVTKDIVFRSEFGKNNRFEKSEILKKLKKEFLPGIAEIVGKENILEFETDLTTLDGLKDYKTMKSKVGLPTFDFYRSNREIFDKYKLDTWWWLSTADSTNNNWCVCVSPSGYFNYIYCSYGIGVRPFCRFVSSISVSRVN